MPLLNHTPQSDEFRCEFCGKLFTRKHLNVYHRNGYRSYCTTACIDAERAAKAVIRDADTARREEMRPAREKRAALRAEARALEEERVRALALIEAEEKLLKAERARVRAVESVEPVTSEPHVYVSPYVGVPRPRPTGLLVPPMVRQRPI